MRRRAVTLVLAALVALPMAAHAAPAPDPAPGGGPGPDAAPTYTPPAPHYTPPTPSYTPPTYVAPVRPTGPTPAEPGTAGADLVQASGVRVAAATPIQEADQAEPAPATTPEPAVTPVAPAVSAPETDAAAPASAPATPPAATTPAPVQETPVAAATLAEEAAAPAPAPNPLPAADRGSSSLPIDGLGLLLVLLACGLALAVRAFRHGQRRLAIPLLLFCAAYVAVVGGVFAGVANAANPADLNLEAVPGDGEVLLTWTPPASGDVLISAGTTPVVNCADPAARTITSADGATAVDSGLTNDITVYYAACIRDAGVLTESIKLSATPTAGVDGTAPEAVSSLRVTAENSRVRIRWTAPPVDDLAEIVIVRRFGARPPQSAKDGIVVYRGLATTATDFPVSPKNRVWYAAFAIDDDENVSTPVTGSLPRFDPPLYGPRDGSVIGRTALFRWRAVSTASYYNVQIWRGAASRKVISTWVARPSYVLRQKLAPGRYTWYVFPGFGARSLARYGALVGSATFVVR